MPTSQTKTRHINWNGLTPEKFLAEYWQKKPLLIKGGFKNFVDPISADELAGLAMEDMIESRIIAHQSLTNWQVDHGPFEDFSQYGESSWTLLVQAVNNWNEGTNRLITPFKFLPNWRIDDVMVSFSTPQGGVGAHLDQYDVFIIQGEGKRHWRVGMPDNTLETLIPHEDLKQVSDFEAVIDEITEPGDILYIPPHHPHNGVSIENSLNYSIGFQAPNSQELLSSLADTFIDQELGELRFPDIDRTVTSTPQFLTLTDVEKLKTFMLSSINQSGLFSDMLSRFLTRSHHTLEVLIPVEPFTEESLAEYLQDDEIIIRSVLGIKSLINQENNQLYINGDTFELDEDTQDLGLLISSGQTLTAEEIKSSKDCLKNRQLLSTILNMGYWYID